MKAYLKRITLLVVAIFVFFLVSEAVFRTGQYVGVIQKVDRETILPINKELDRFNPGLVRVENQKLGFVYDKKNELINSLGYRGEAVRLEKPPDVVRIVLLGDSVTYGFGLPWESTFAFYLQDQLQQQLQRPVEVLNFAVNGYGLESCFERYKIDARKYSPDIVMVSFSATDVAPSTKLFEVVKRLFEKVARVDKIGRYSQFIAWLYVKYDQVVSPIKSRKKLEKLYRDENTIIQIESILEGFSGFRRQDDVKMFFTIFPGTIDLENYPNHRFHEQIKAILSEKHIPYYDMFDTFSLYDSRQLQLTQADKGHLNPLGHQLTAEALVDFINEKFLSNLN